LASQLVHIWKPSLQSATSEWATVWWH